MTGDEITGQAIRVSERLAGNLAPEFLEAVDAICAAYVEEFTQFDGETKTNFVSSIQRRTKRLLMAKFAASAARFENPKGDE